jgi:hypothetical protein
MTEQTEQDLGALITEVVGPLKTEADWLLQQAQILQATQDEHFNNDEINKFAGQCDEVSQKANAGKEKLTSGGVQDWVYSVQACHELAFRASEAAQYARQAAASDSPTDTRAHINSAVDACLDGKSKMDGTS